MKNPVLRPIWEHMSALAVPNAGLLFQPLLFFSSLPSFIPPLTVVSGYSHSTSSLSGVPLQASSTRFTYLIRRTSCRNLEIVHVPRGSHCSICVVNWFPTLDECGPRRWDFGFMKIPQPLSSIYSKK